MTSVYRPYCLDVVAFGDIREQPIPAYTVDDEHQHHRQRVVNAKKYNWNLELEHKVDCIERNKICVASLNVNTGKMV